MKRSVDKTVLKDILDKNFKFEIANRLEIKIQLFF